MNNKLLENTDFNSYLEKNAVLNIKDVSDVIIPALLTHKSIAFTYKIDEAFVLTVLLNLEVKNLSFLNGLSNEEENFIWVSILKIGSFRFNITSNFHEEYLQEKLNISINEAIAIKELLSKISKNLFL